MRAKLLSSFLSVDLKLGSSVISLLGILNKVAGLYGLISLLAAELTWSQISLYVYSLATLVIYLWGLKGIADENPNVVLNYSHLFTLDHFVGTTYSVFFGVSWWFFHPHDGRREYHSEAQKEILENGALGSAFDPEQRRLAAQDLWSAERGFALGALACSWIVKIYFILCLYSFALHLRRGSYRHVAAGAKASPVAPAVNRRRSANYVYSHVRDTSDAASTSWARDGSDQQDEIDLDRIDVTDLLSRPARIPAFEEVPPSPADGAPIDPSVTWVSGASPTQQLKVTAPAMIRSRSASDTKNGEQTPV